jgi:hypothetical protein
MPNPGIAKQAFERLGRPICTRADADAVASDLLPVVVDAVRHQKGATPKSVFISYSREDRTWLEQVAAILQPLERAGHVRIWTDVEIEPGSLWDATLHRELSVCDLAILLVSTNFLESEYVRKVELPILLERARANRTRLLWVIADECDWESTEFGRVQALTSNQKRPLRHLSASDLQLELVRLRREVEKFTSAARIAPA